MRMWRITPEAIQAGVLSLFMKAGVKVLTDIPMVDFPHGFTPAMRLDFGGLGDTPHSCEREPRIDFPWGFLVMDIVVTATGGCQFAASKRFRSYFSGPAVAVHPGMKVDETIWRPATSVEAYAAFVPNTWAGSFQFGSPHTISGLAQVFWLEDRGPRVSAFVGFPGHHKLYLRRDTAPDPIPTVAFHE